jgi:hypothetical protein
MLFARLRDPVQGPTGDATDMARWPWGVGGIVGCMALLQSCRCQKVWERTMRVATGANRVTVAGYSWAKTAEGWSGGAGVGSCEDKVGRKRKIILQVGCTTW